MTRSRRLGVAEALVDGEFLAGDVTIAGGHIESVGLPVGPRARGTAVPGFVDWQVNGFAGVQFIDAGAGEMEAAMAELASAGIVYACPTFYSASFDQYCAALAELASLHTERPGGGLLGAHLEGPFLSASFAGAHDPGRFEAPDPGLLRKLCRRGPVAMLTLAPELPGADRLVEAAVAAGVLISVGHTDATSQRCREVADAGALAMTHCWNAHRRFTPRDPGPAGWALTDSRVAVGLVADGIHVAPEVLALTFASARGRVALTTDAIWAAGTDGASESARRAVQQDASRQRRDQEVRIEGGAARLRDGTLAGSIATPSHMLRVLVGAGVGLTEALSALHRPQAMALGLGQWAMRPGDPAHVVVLDDELEVRAAWRNGEPLTR